MAKKTNPAAGFLDAILASPDDDTHRLVYADWLDDNGDPERAEFIRAQCALERLNSADPAWIEHRIREYQLGVAHQKDWQAEAPKWTHKRDLHFGRGFPARISCGGKEWARYGANLATRTVIDDVFLSGDVDETTLAALAASPHLGRLCNFGAQNSLPRILRELLPRMSGLRDLFLPTPWDHPRHVTDEVLSLLRLPNLPALQSLELRAKPGHALAPALDRPGLRDLRLLVEDLPPAELAEVLDAPFVPGLRRLWLDEELSAEGCRLLAATPSLAGLKSLRIGFFTVEVEASLEAILDSPTLANLTALHLDNIGDEGLNLLARSPGTRRLRSLTLWPKFRDPTPRAFQRLLESGGLTGLHRLGLGAGLASPKFTHVLAMNSSVPYLTHLSLLDRYPTPGELADLTKSPHRTALRAVSTPDGLPAGSHGVAVPSGERIWETW
jgi:uncharacterized protein (TIGR02996 family)